MLKLKFIADAMPELGQISGGILLGHLSLSPSPSQDPNFDLFFHDGDQKLPCFLAFPLDLQWISGGSKQLILTRWKLRLSATVKGLLVLEILSVPVPVSNNAVTISIRHRAFLDPEQLSRMQTMNSQAAQTTPLSSRESVLNLGIVAKILMSSRHLDSKAVDFLKQLSILGVIVAKSPLFRSHDGGPFFFLELASTHDESVRVPIVFRGAKSPLFHRMLFVGKSHMLKGLRVMTLFASKPNERKVLVFDDATSLVTELNDSDPIEIGSIPADLSISFSMASLADATHCLDSGFDPSQLPAESDQLKIDSPISYTGQVTAILDYSWRLVEIDHVHLAFLSHCDGYIWQFLARGQTITLRNVYITIDGSTCTFLCSAYSQVELDLETEESRDDASDPLETSKQFNVSLISHHDLPFAKAVHDALTKFSTKPRSWLNMLVIILTKLGRKCDRNIYDEFFIVAGGPRRNRDDVKILTPSALLEIVDKYTENIALSGGLGIKFNTISSSSLDSSNVFLLANLICKNDASIHLSDADSTLRVSLDGVDKDAAASGFVLVSRFDVVLESLQHETHHRILYLRTSPSDFIALTDFVKPPSLSLDDKVRIVFIRDIVGPLLELVPQSHLAMYCYGTSFRLQQSLNADELKFVDVAEFLLTVDGDALRQMHLFQLGTWLLISTDWADLNVGVATESQVPRKQAHLRVSNSVESVTIFKSDSKLRKLSLDATSLFLATHTERSFNASSGPRTVKDVLDESVKSIGQASFSNYLPRLVSFVGVVLQKEMRMSDSYCRGEGWYCTAQVSRDFNVGFGMAGTVLYLKICDIDGNDAIDMYLDLFKYQYPLGVLPGTVVSFYNVALKVSKNRTVYAVNAPGTVISTHGRHASSFDDPLAQKGGVTISMEQLLDSEPTLRHLAELTVKNSTTTLSLFYFVGNVTIVKDLTFRWICSRCHGSIYKRKCPNACFVSVAEGECLFKGEMECQVRDGSSQATMKLGDPELIFALLGLTEEQQQRVREVCWEYGHFGHSDMPSMERREKTEAVNETADSMFASFSHQESMEMAAVQATIKSVFSGVKRRNILFECQLLSRKQGWIPSDLKQHQKMFRDLGLAECSVKLNGIMVRTIAYPRITLTCRRVARPALVDLATLLSKQLRK